MVGANEPAQHPTIDIASQIGEEHSMDLAPTGPSALWFSFRKRQGRQSVMTTTLDQAQSAGR
jgi:hypothetical protein